MKKFFLAYVFLAFITACGGDSSGGGSEPQPTPPSPPGSFSLVNPPNNAVCVESRSHSITASAGATSYDWKFVAADGTVLHEATTGSSQLTLQVATSILPDNLVYTWHVTAKNNDGEKVSATWTASTPGTPQVNYCPTVQINFSTETIIFNDNEDEALSYTIFQSSENNFDGVPVLDSGNIDAGTSKTFDDIGFTQSWIKIQLEDASGNTSPDIIQSY